MSDLTTQAAESKERLWPIGLWIVMLVAVAGAGVLGSLHHRRAGQKEAARAIVQHELTKLHWSTLEPDPQFRRVIAAVSEETRVQLLSTDWSVRLLAPSGAQPAPLDAFETAAIEKISRGATDEVWQESLSGVTRYVRAVRAGSVCVSCHPVTKSGNVAKVNDVIGVLSIDFGKRDRTGSPVALIPGGP